MIQIIRLTVLVRLKIRFLRAHLDCSAPVEINLIPIPLQQIPIPKDGYPGQDWLAVPSRTLNWHEASRFKEAKRGTARTGSHNAQNNSASGGSTVDKAAAEPVACNWARSTYQGLRICAISPLPRGNSWMTSSRA